MVVPPFVPLFVPRFSGAYGVKTYDGRILLHGREYNLGTMIAVYNVDNDSFVGGGRLIARDESIFADKKCVDGKMLWVGGSSRLYPPQQGEMFSEEPKDEAKRATYLFDQITGASYHGANFRQLLRENPAALQAAEMLVKALLDAKMPGTESESP